MDNQDQRPEPSRTPGTKAKTARRVDFTPDFDEARKFLTALDETEEVFCFQVFTDKPSGKTSAEHKHGTLESLQKWLEAKTRAEAGVFVCINETDGKGRKGPNITRVRANFADFDTPGAFQERNLPLEPHIVVESSPGKFHAYWLVDGLPLDQFEGVQCAIIERLGTDPNVKDVSRVMRLPGFYHQKGEPFLVTCRVNEFQPYTPEQILEAFPPVKKTESRNNDKFEDNGKVREPGRNRYLTREAGKLRRMGLDPADIFQLLLKRNREKCDPPIEVEEVRRIAKSIGRYEPENDAPKAYELIEFPKLMTVSPIDWLINGWLERQTVGVMFGESSVGKSLIALDMALSCASGIPWQGVTATQGAVVYICGEGLNGFKRRIKAWDITNAPHNPHFFLGRAVPLLDDLATVSVVAAIRERNLNPALICVDTLARNYGGAEADSEDMAKFVAHIDHLRDLFGATVLIVHHCGHNNKDRARGAYSLKCAIDSEIRVEKDPDGVITMTAQKMRDGDLPEPMSFNLRKVNVGEAAEDGSPIDSVVLEPTKYTPPDSSDRGFGANQTKALNILRKLVERHKANLREGDYPEERARISRTEFYEEWKNRGLKKQRAYDTLSGLAKRGIIRFDDFYISFSDSEDPAA